MSKIRSHLNKVTLKGQFIKWDETFKVNKLFESSTMFFKKRTMFLINLVKTAGEAFQPNGKHVQVKNSLLI